MIRIKSALLLAVHLSFIIHHLSLNAQHPSWRNLTTSNGLPSNEAYDLLRDKQGFMWFATKEGVCRFNGYEFSRPVDTSRLANASTYRLYEDDQGRIWFNNLDATLYLIENDTVRPWEFNYLIRQYKGKFVSFRTIAIDKDGTVWIPLVNLGFLVVHPDGQNSIEPNLDRNALIFKYLNGRTIFSMKAAGVNSPYYSRKWVDIIYLGNTEFDSVGNYLTNKKISKINNLFGALKLKNGDYIQYHEQYFQVIRNKHVIWQREKDTNVNNIVEAADGSILLASLGRENKGLLRFPSMELFQQNKFHNILPNHVVTNVCEDGEGGLWATTKDAGVFYCKYLELEIFDASCGLTSSDVVSLSSNAKNMVYAGMETSDICSIDSKNGRIIKMPVLPPDYFELTLLHYDTVQKRLWSGTLLNHLKKNEWIGARYFDPKFHIFRHVSVKKLSRGISGNLWASSAFGFFSIDPFTGIAERIPKDSLANERTFSVAEDFNGNIWVTTMQGLRLWRNGCYELPFFRHPALRFPARNVEMLPDSGMVIALEGGGLLIREKNGQFSHFTKNQGLTSNSLGELRISWDGVIYACSNAGLNVLHHKEDGAWQIETLTKKHGLPSNQVNDVALLGGEIWIATDRGIARFYHKPVALSIPAPQLEWFRVNNRDTVFVQDHQLNYDQNNIVLRFFSLHFRSDGDIPYRYRLLGADSTFMYTHTREVSFVRLPPGKYKFEVQAQNENGLWSDSAIWAFEIRPPWWASWWFRIPALAALLLGISLFYQNRLRAVRREAAVQQRIRELQNTALRAQMNPHFIFNSLASIQHFIAGNDAPAATRYLARFARLVRLALYGSMDGKHALSDEVEMLDNYLALEQLRFRGKFNYDIQVAPELEHETIQIPPMLVQPFVENAIVHGMKNKAQGGRIALQFSKIKECLAVTIRDNGPGFDSGANSQNPEQETGHKSVGIGLTKNRLELLGDNSSGAAFTQENLMSADGNIIGAQVCLLLKIS